MAEKEKTLVAVLNWNGITDTIACVNSLLASDFSQFEIAIVDNGSLKNEGKKIDDYYKKNNRVVILLNNANLGYCGGNNTAFSYAKEKNYDNIIILNNDTVADKELVNSLVEAIADDQSCALVGATIMDFTDHRMVQSRGIKINLFLGISRQIISGGENVRIDSVSGTCFIADIKKINSTDLFDRDFFCYYEETNLSLSLKQRGFKVKTSEKALVFHKGSVTAKTVKGMQEYFSIRNRFLLIKKRANIFQIICFFLSQIIYMPVKILALVATRRELLGYFFRGYFEGWSFFFRGKSCDNLFKSTQ